MGREPTHQHPDLRWHVIVRDAATGEDKAVEFVDHGQAVDFHGRMLKAGLASRFETWMPGWREKPDDIKPACERPGFERTECRTHGHRPGPTSVKIPK